MKFIAFYLPQYHRIPENDVWWGEGFTDWVNVKKTRPRFLGHWQPHTPMNGNYYDLSRAGVIDQQSELAAQYGVDAFCLYHYWFNGKLLLEKPVTDFASADHLATEFCLCWANENWTRTWDGWERKILIKQDYSMVDHEKHFKWFIPYLYKKRYLRLNNKPMILIYNPSAIPEIEGMISLWREMAYKEGLGEICMGAVDKRRPGMSQEEMIQKGFDCVVGFHPSNDILPEGSFLQKKLRGQKDRINKQFDRFGVDRRFRFELSQKVSYAEYFDRTMRNSDVNCYYPCVTPTWDNSARRYASLIVQNTDAELFQKWLRLATEKCKNSWGNENEQVVFINAWNEWAEGCHLEPDEKMGYAFLEAVKNTKRYLK